MVCIWRYRLFLNFYFGDDLNDKIINNNVQHNCNTVNFSGDIGIHIFGFWK